MGLVSLLLAGLASGTPYATRPLFGLRGGSESLGLFELRGGSVGGSSSGSDTALLNNLQVLKKRLETLETRLKESPRSGDDVPVMADPETGDRVRVRRNVKRPRFDWGDGVSHDSVGRLTWFCGDRCTVDFPRHPEWNGMLAEMERAALGRELPRVGDRVQVGRSVKEPAGVQRSRTTRSARWSAWATTRSAPTRKRASCGSMTTPAGPAASPRWSS